MSQLGSEFRVGLFTVGAVMIIGYMFFVLSPDTFESKDKIRYYTVVKDAAGIVNKTHVKTNGVIVGKVVGIRLEVNQTRIDVEIKDNVKVPQGSSIAIKEKGLLGDVFLEIVRGDDVGIYLKNGDFIPPTEDQVSISALISIAGSIGKDIKEVTAVLSKVLGGKKGEQNISSIVTDLRELASNTRAIVEENRDDLRSILINIEETSASVRRVLGTKEKDLMQIISNVKLATKDLREFSSSINSIVDAENKERIEKIIASFDNTMQDVEVTAKNVRLVADKIEKGEGTIGKLVNEDRTLNELELAIKDIREVLAPATKMQLAVDYHGEIRKDESTQHYFNTYIQTRPDKFFLLGFTDLNEAIREEREEQIADDGRRIRTVEKKAIRFNAQFGKRWHDFQLRFGLFESTGGLGSDLFLLNDKIKLTIEAFDWANTSIIRKTAHLKAYVSILFFQHLYALIGVDDPSKYEPDSEKISGSRNYFIGAGLNFNDNDLKAIFGTAALVL